MADGEALVIGAGVVGSATGQVLADGGLRVSAYDPDATAASRFPGPVVSRADCMRPWQLVVIAVPTPTNDGQMDTEPLGDALGLVAEIASRGLEPLAVAIRSTLVPGTMDGMVASHVVHESAVIDACHWPCFARERSAVDDERTPRHTVIGSANPGGHAVSMIREAIAHLAAPMSVVRPVEAELIKHGANLFNSLKISYFNALADWATEFGAEGQPVADLVASVAEGAWNTTYGTRTGPAFGGACLPKDLLALEQALTAHNRSHLGLFDVIREVNSDPRRSPGQGATAGS